MKSNLLILAILTFMLICPQDIFAKSQKDASIDSVLVQKHPLKNLTIITPHSEIWSEGTFKKQFFGYSIFDTDENLLINVGQVIDTPVTVKIKEGTYISLLDNHNPTKFYITVTSEHYQEFQIQE
jgi:hypothetical protein